MSRESDVSFAQVLASLQQKPKEDLSSTFYLKLEFLDSIPNYDNKDMSYYNTYRPGDHLNDIFTVNEHLAVLLSLVANTLIVLVFVRVLGLARLPSRLIVSLAAVNLVTSLSVALHTAAVNSLLFANSEEDCRFVACLYHNSNILFYYILCCAIVERIIACNMPIYYSRALHIIGPTVIVSPWAFWTMNILLLNAGVYNFDLGFECMSHKNLTYPHYSMDAGERFAHGLACVLVMCLLLSMIFHNQSSGDVWEINRSQFEIKTTWVLLRMIGLIAAFSSAEALCPLLRINGLTYDETRIWHVATQFSVHKGISLFIVLLARKEFRRQMLFVFESKQNIKRTRTANLLITQNTARQQSSRQLRFSGQAAEQQQSGSGRETPTTGPRGKTSPHPLTAMPLVVPDSQTIVCPKQGGMLSRDKQNDYETPEWLLKKEAPAPVWSLSRLLGRQKSSPVASVANSD